MDQVARDVLKARNLTAPIGEIKGLPLSDFKG
jgi:hypothetical protein